MILLSSVTSIKAHSHCACQRTLTSLRMSTFVSARQRASTAPSTSVDLCERTSTSGDACHRTLTDTYVYNICKYYVLMIYTGMLMIFSIIIYVIKMQIKHVIISNLISGCYYCGNARWSASMCVMVRYNYVKMTLKSNLSLCVARRPTTRGNVRNVNAAVLLHAFD